MIRKSVSFSVILLALAIAIASCSSTKHSTRKCDGRKGQKTPMGLL